MAKDSLEMLREKAQDALARGQYQEARQLYQQALGYRSDHPDLHYGIAAVCFVLGDLHSAAYHFKEVTRLDSSRAGAHINLGAVYNRLGQFDDALTALRKGISIDKNRAEGYYNLALVYKQLGQIEMAVNAYREAVRVNPRMYEAQYNLGNLFFEKGQFALATAHYRHALEVRPDWDKAKTALASAIEEQAKVESTHSAVLAPTLKEAKFDPNRTIDPDVHGKWLRELHNLIIDTDHSSQAMLEFLQQDVERVIRELSICILTPADMQHSLDDQIQKFDAMMTQLQQLRDGLQKRILKARLMGEQMMKT